jgi:hypothetical protein
MWEGYTNAVAEFVAAHPEVSLEVVIDRFHVAENYREGVDLLRKQECRLKEELSAEEYAEIQGVLWTLRKNREDFDRRGTEKTRAPF